MPSAGARTRGPAAPKVLVSYNLLQLCYDLMERLQQLVYDMLGLIEMKF